MDVAKLTIGYWIPDAAVNCRVIICESSALIIHSVIHALAKGLSTNVIALHPAERPGVSLIAPFIITAEHQFSIAVGNCAVGKTAITFCSTYMK